MKARARPEGTDGAVKIRHSSVPEAARTQGMCWAAAWRRPEAGAEVRPPHARPLPAAGGRGSLWRLVSATHEDRRTDGQMELEPVPQPPARSPSLASSFLSTNSFPEVHLTRD